MVNITIHFVLLLSTLAFLSVIEGKTSADLTNAELDKIKENFDNIRAQAYYTCENYKEKCNDSDPKELCEIFAKSYVCDQLNGREDIRKIMSEIEKIDPEYIDQWTQQ